MGLQIESSVFHIKAPPIRRCTSPASSSRTFRTWPTGNVITPEHQAVLGRLLEETTLGRHITAVKIWDEQGRVVYATEPANLGLTMPIDSQLPAALRGCPPLTSNGRRILPASAQTRNHAARMDGGV
jgi:hypothetical protein